MDTGRLNKAGEGFDSPGETAGSRPASITNAEHRAAFDRLAQRLADHACSVGHYERSGAYAIVKAADLDRLAHYGREMHGLLRRRAARQAYRCRDTVSSIKGAA